MNEIKAEEKQYDYMDDYVEKETYFDRLDWDCSASEWDKWIDALYCI